MIIDALPDKSLNKNETETVAQRRRALSSWIHKTAADERTSRDPLFLAFLRLDGSSREFASMFKTDDSFTSKTFKKGSKLMTDAVEFTISHLSTARSEEHFDVCSNNAFKSCYSQGRDSKEELLQAIDALEKIE